ncbi:MAG: exonuclease domain-containing protein, partial [Oscillospiraceae bacterium]
MNYIVVDLEWNQAMSSKSSVFNKLPIKLRGEIIEIGAVKLDENLQPAEEFTIDVKPVYFKRMHYKVKKLTGFDKERLAKGLSFRDAFEQFREWCGDGVTFLTWGCDDRGIMEQNIIIHDLDWDWIAGWINLQLIYNMQTDGDKNQKSLATAMEHFEIEQTRIAHDALGDAYNTALICSKLNMAEGLAQYDAAARTLATRSRKESSADNGPEALEHLVFPGYVSKSDAFADEELTKICCPKCGSDLSAQRWINQG